MTRTVTIVVPARNEAPSIGGILDGARPYADELLVIDGHSTDGTADVAREHGASVLLDDGKGKGSALRQAIQASTTDLILFIDADGSHDPEDIPRVLAPLHAGEADLVIASRPMGGSDELHGDFEKVSRMIGSHIITLCINYRFDVRLSDSQNGFRALTTACAQSLHLREDSTTIEQEMLMQALHRGYRVKEVAAHEYARTHGKSTIVLNRVAHRYVYSLVRDLFVRSPER